MHAGMKGGEVSSFEGVCDVLCKGVKGRVLYGCRLGIVKRLCL